MEQNKDLPISQLLMAVELNGQEIVPFAKETTPGNFANGAFTVELLMSIIREGLATQSAVNGKQNKLTPGYGIVITPENEIRTNLDISPFEVVDELPTADIKNKIYCVPDPDGEVGKNELIEYLWMGDHWEEVGKFAPKVDLSEYLKSANAERIYAKKSEIPDISPLATKIALNVVSEELAQLKVALNTLKGRVDAIPGMPTHDGRTYGVKNGVWESIAEVGQVVATCKADEDATS